MSRMLVDGDAIRALADLLTETKLTEIEISEGENRIRVVRGVAPVVQAAPLAALNAAALHAPTVGAPSDNAPHPGAVNSPMVGVAYLTPDPASPPFVQEGQSVSAGQTLLLIEAMKTFNQIKAPRSGTVKRVLVASGAPVEFGEPLVILE